MSYFHLVLGTGPLGIATARALVARGEFVRLVNRSGAAAGLPAGAAISAADLADRARLRNLAEGAAAIHFCVQPPYDQWPAQFPALQDSAIALAAETGARLVVAENLYGYGPVDGPMTEATPLNATTRKGAVRAAMHRTLLAAYQAGRIDMAVARGADFFGPDVMQAALGVPVFDAVAKGRTARVLGNPDLPHSYTYVPDFGTAMATLALAPGASGQVFHVPNAAPLTTREMLTIVAGLCGTRLRLAAIAPWQLRLLAIGMRPLREMVELTYQATRPFVADHSKFVAAFGDIATPRKDAVAATLQSLSEADAPSARAPSNRRAQVN